MLKKLTITLAGFVLSAAAMTTHASLDGMKVVLVHGFQAEDLNNSNRSQKASQYGSYENYMKYRASNVYWSGPWKSKADASIWWDSKERITGGIATDVKNQLKALSNNSNFKGKPILLVTHSTGDLVARHALKRLGGWSNGGLTKPFIRGMDDSVVPMHSACMAASIESIDSCSNGIANNGVIKSVNGPNNGVWSNYYPILMGEKTNHGGTIGGQTGSQFATVNSSNSMTKNNVNLSFATTTKKYWWSWGKKVRWVNSGSSKKMSDVVISATNY